MRLKYRVLLGFAMLALIFVSVLLGGFLIIAKTTKQIDSLVDREFAATSLIEDSHRTVITIHAEVWDAMLAGTEARTRAKGRLDALAVHFYANLRSLRDRLLDDDTEALRRQFEAYYLFGSTILDFRDPAEFKAKREVADKFVSNKRQLLDTLDQRIGPTKAAFKASLERLKALFNTARWVTISLLALLLVAALILSLVLAGRITRPLERLTTVARAVASGDFKGFPPIEAPAELGTLANAFQTMLNRVNATLIELRHEVHERTQAEQSLQHARDYLSTVLDSVSSILVTVDAQGCVTHWNMKAQEVTAIASAQAMGKPAIELIPTLTSYAPRIKQVMDEGIAAIYRRESWKLGSMLWVDVAIYPLGPRGGVVLRLDDATELEKKDEQLRHVQRMETASIIAGGLAHDFNNILAAIYGTVSLMKFDLSAGRLEAASLTEHAEVIEHATSRAADLVKSLLVISRKQQLTFHRVELGSILESTAKLCRNTVDKSIQVQLTGTDVPLHVRADATQIAEVVLNMCINGWHAMTLMRRADERRGGTLTIGLHQQEADLQYCVDRSGARPGRYGVITVRDQGVGMDRATRERAFDPFFTTKAGEGGTGLGLAMAFNVVQLHGGFIDLYSDEGQGTEFKIYLPLMDELGRSIRETEVQPVRGTGVVLVVDDEPAVLKVAANILRQCGYQVFTAEDGDRALQLFAEAPERYQLVLLDMAMPRLSGLEVIKKLQEIRPDVRVLIESGFGADPRIAEAVQIGAVGFIQKPYTMADLSNRVRDAIESN